MEYRIKLEKKFEKFWMPAYTETAVHMMFFASGMILNACSLSEAYNTLVRSGNRLSANAFLRMLVDNCLQIYGLILHEDKMGYLDAYWNNKLYQFQHNGNKMTGSYLKRKLNEKYNKIEEYYDNGCLIVHPSKFFILNSMSYSTKSKEIIDISHDFADFSSDNIDKEIEYVKNVFEDLLDILALETHKYEAKVDSSWDFILDKCEYTRFVTLINKDGSFRVQYDSFFERLKKPVCFDENGTPIYMNTKKLLEDIRTLYNGKTTNGPIVKKKALEIGEDIINGNVSM